jgi:hypothetical protein
MILEYEVYSKIKFRLVGKNKRVGIAPNHKFSSNKQSLLSLNTNSHPFSLSSVGVIADETWTLSTSLPPAEALLDGAFFVAVEVLGSQPDLHLGEEMVIAWRQVRTVRRVATNLPVEALD